MTSAMTPGSFDPPTNGHVDVITRSAALFERVVVAVVRNPSKQPLFTDDERVAMLQELFVELPGVEVTAFDGLLVEFARAQSVDVIVKGLRGAKDFDYELQMAHMNHHLTGVDTWFIPTRPEYGYLSSSLVKEVARLGGDVHDFLPPMVHDRLTKRLKA